MKWLLKEISAITGGLGLETLVSSGGIWLVAQLLKFVPGMGTVAGAVISGSVAAAITGALGISISEICYRISKYTIEGKEKELKDMMSNLNDVLKEEFEKQYEKRGVFNDNYIFPSTTIIFPVVSSSNKSSSKDSDRMQC